LRHQCFAALLASRGVTWSVIATAKFCGNRTGVLPLRQSAPGRDSIPALDSLWGDFMKWLERLAARLLARRVKGFAISVGPEFHKGICERGKTHGILWGDGWQITF
jgi:hypothetical protein